MDPPGYSLGDLDQQKEQCEYLEKELEAEKKAIKEAGEAIDRALEDGTITRPQHDQAKNALDNAEKVGNLSFLFPGLDWNLLQ